MNYTLILPFFFALPLPSHESEILRLVTKKTSEIHISEDKHEFVSLKNNISNIKKSFSNNDKYIIIGDNLTDYLILNNLNFLDLKEKEQVYSYYQEKFKNKIADNHIKYLQLNTAFIDKTTDYIFVGIKNQNESIKYSNHYKILHPEYKNFTNNFFVYDYTKQQQSDFNHQTKYYDYLKSLKSNLDVSHEKNHKVTFKQEYSKTECHTILKSNLCNIIINNDYYKGLYSESVADIGSIYDLQTEYPSEDLTYFTLMARFYEKNNHQITNDIHDTYYAINAFNALKKIGDKEFLVKRATYLGIIHKQFYTAYDHNFIEENKSVIVDKMTEISKRNIIPQHLKSK